MATNIPYVFAAVIWYDPFEATTAAAEINWAVSSQISSVRVSWVANFDSYSRNSPVQLPRQASLRYWPIRLQSSR